VIVSGDRFDGEGGAGMGTGLEGIFPVLQLPFNDKGVLNKVDLKTEVNFCVKAGAHGLVVLAMASEVFALSDDERREVVEIVTKEAHGRVPVIIGVSGVCKEVAVLFSKHAADNGADGIIAIPPYVRHANKDGIIMYYRGISNTVNIPIIMQNTPALGNLLPITDLLDIIEQVEGISYVKEEGVPTGQRISTLLKLTGKRLRGVFGGGNGLWLLNELRRGACGCMPTAAVVDIQVKIFELYKEGSFAEARQLQNTLLPLLNLASLYGVSLAKNILKRRDVITYAFVRDPKSISLDQFDLEEIDIIWPKIEPLFTL